MRLRTILAILLLATVGLTVGSVGALGTAPTPPAAYYGEAYINGSPAPAGTQITAYIDGSVAGTITTDANGTFGGPGTFDEKLNVRGTSEDEGKRVKFKIGNQTANKTVKWSAGDHRQLMLGVGGCGALTPSLSTPTDPDGDGDFEDTNGNGRFDFNDIVTFFDHLSSASPDCQDFNNNGRIDFDDIVTLFQEI